MKEVYETSHIKDDSIENAEAIVELRADHQTARLLSVWLECIGLALSKGVVSPDRAADLRANLPELRSGSDDFTERFCALVEEKRAEHEVQQKQRRKWRRAA